MRNLLVRAAHPLRRLYWRAFKPRTFGVKVAVFSPDRRNVLLVRHRYGSASLMLPGGAIEKNETGERAARREILEELGIEIDEVELRHTFRSNSEGKRDTVMLFTAIHTQPPIADPAELSAVEACPIDALPADVSPATRRRLSELERNSFSSTW